MKEIEFIESMKVLKLELGDIIVLKTGKVIPEEHVMKIKEYFTESFKDLDNKILLLQDGMDIGILRKDNV